MKCVATLVALWMLTTPGTARAVVVLSDSFDDSNVASFAVPGSGWTAGYCADTWQTDLSGGVMSSRDDGCDQCNCNFVVYTSGSNTCVQSDPFDNHIKTGNLNWQNYRFQVRFKNLDDDSMGVVFRYVRSDHFYLFVVSRDSTPDPFTGCSRTYSGARLIRFLPDAQPVVIKQSATTTFTVGMEHLVRVIATGRHLRIEFDSNGDGFISADEIFFDGDDTANQAIYRGMVGLYAYENGIYQDWAPAPCATGDCWFDDVLVDLLEPNNVNCGTVSQVGTCTGNVLRRCDETGQLVEQVCAQGSCCGWHSGQGQYACLGSSSCGNGCQVGCESGQTGCSANLTHRWVCGQGDADPCIEPVYHACATGEYCDPSQGKCVSTCQAQCQGKQCGPDGCGGLCGTCSAGKICQQGQCVTEVPAGEFGSPCTQHEQCQSGMCLNTPAGKHCSQPCSPAIPCPVGWVCDSPGSDAPTGWCTLPSACVPDCAGKQCGPNGCGGECGICVPPAQCLYDRCRQPAGQPCSLPEDCLDGLCIPYPDGTLCSTPCVTDAICPQGWECSAWLDPGSSNICAPKQNPAANPDCLAIIDCTNQCSETPEDSNCFASCFFEGSKPAKARYSSLFFCMTQRCTDCLDDPCLMPCIVEECFQQYASCYPGELSCAQALDCLYACGDAGDTCGEQCFVQAMPAAKLQLMALFGCIDEACPQPSPVCFSTAVGGPCLEFYESCMTACNPVCGAAECGPDGCGGDCGQCGGHEYCDYGQCKALCVPACEQRECGPDGCGGQCGICPAETNCVAGVCVAPNLCTSRHHTGCHKTDLWWFDSCNQPEEVAQECEYGCFSGKCARLPVGPDVTADGDSSFMGLDPNAPPVELSSPRSGNCAVPGTNGRFIEILLVLMGLLGVVWRMRVKGHA
jgi:hypothetical protein